MPPEWGVQSLRLTVFSNQPTFASDSDWRALTGEAEAPNRNTIPGGRALSGPFNRGQLVVGQAGTRLDISLLPPNVENPAEPSLPVIGSWDEIRPSFVAATSRWLEVDTFPVTRIAFGATLLWPATDRLDAYRKLDGLLVSITIDPEHMRDLQYRINWPVPSAAVPGLTINRITGWNAVSVVHKLLQVTGNQVSSSDATPGLDAVVMEIDHNTDPAHTVAFDTSVQIPIYQELIELAGQNAEKGERP